MSEKTEEAKALDKVTKERDELATKLAAAEKSIEKLQEEKLDGATKLAQATAKRDEFKSSADAANRLLQGARQALHIDEHEDVIEAINRVFEGFEGLERAHNALADQLDQADAGLPNLAYDVDDEGKPTTRSHGWSRDGDRYVHVERVDFSQDLGYGKDQIERRAKAAIDRALVRSHKELPGDCGGLPPFAPTRALTVVLEIA